MIKECGLRKSIKNKTKYAALLLLFFLFSYILPLGVRDLAEPDETRYAEIPREMIASGDWVVPHLNGVRYFEKPVMGYWANAVSLLLLGDNNFAVRLPSALSTGLMALLIYLLVRGAYRRKNDEDVGDDTFLAILAAFVFLSCLEVFAVGNTAVLDNLFSLFTTASVSAFYFATEERPGSGREKCLLALAGMSCGIAFLTKGFVAFVIPVISFVPYLIWQHRYFDLLRMSWLPVLLAVIVILPWGISISLREPDFWRFFFWNEHVRRFLSDNAQHNRPFWFFFLISPAAFFPWSFLLPAGIVGVRDSIKKHGGRDRLLKFCICWLVLPFMFFSFSRGKLLTYILPCFPPFAVLMSIGLMHVLNKDPDNRLFKAVTACSAMLSVVLLVIFLYLQIFGFKGSCVYEQPWKAMMVVTGIVFFIMLVVLALRSRTVKNKVIFYSMAPLLFFFVIHYTVPDITVAAVSPGVMLERSGRNAGKCDIIISDGDSVRSVCWYFQRNNVYMLGDAGELDYGLNYKEARGKLLDKRYAAVLINQNRGRTVLIARSENAARLRGQLPDPVFEDSNDPSGYVLWRY
ncbi:MAG: phospholipid carrier-dependent glycosyltransferase [Synergistaceae bacterium]|nr:phospholipid carrier-dependent glycosyltransferase [Synergistaceae bacterium]